MTRPAVVPGRWQLRPARWADLFVLFRVHRAVFAYPYPFWRFLRYQLSPSSAILLVDDGQLVVGYVIAALAKGYNPPRRIGEVISLAVLDAYRRQGLGARLMARAMSWLEAADVAEIVLQVAVSNGVARALYERLGFEMIDRLPRYYLDGEDAWLMRKVVVAVAEAGGVETR